MIELKRRFHHRKHRKAWRCFADGGAAEGAPAGEPAQPAAGAGTGTPAAAPAKPANTEPAKPQEPPAKAYTEAELQAATAQALAEYKRHLEDAKDYEKMTAEEKVAFLEQQRVNDKLAQYTTAKLAAQELPLDLLPFVQGKDEADTDGRLKAFRAAYDKGVQAGVEKRFKANGYLPRGTAAGEPGKETAKRSRGVSVK